jgi:formate-dependent nitrite reductase membrane component NrfD
VSLYTWTKSIASGAYLVAGLLALLVVAATRDEPPGLTRVEEALTVWHWAAPVVSGAFLALTGALLVWDLEHPARFYMIFTRPQWRSWLVKGAFVIGAYALVLAAHFAASLAGSESVQLWLTIAGLPLAALTAVYTAYLFAQAKARDLWQNPLLPPHLLVQSVVAGSAALAPFAFWLEPRLFPLLLWTLAGACVAHLLLVWGEVTLTHPTAHARLAVTELTRGRYAAYFWAGLALTLLAVAAPWLGLAAVPLALTGLLLYEHAYVQAGQSVPLA